MIALITGGNGQLGYDVTNYFLEKGAKVLSPSSKEFDITNVELMDKYLTDINLDVIIHCAAYTAVDDAESNKDINYEVNVQGTKNIVEIAKKHNAKLIYISTDYVFDGEKDLPYIETDKKNPINEYGKSKSLAEDIVISELQKYFIVRISWVIGINGKNFVKTMLRLSEKMDTLSVIDDQVGSPTFTSDLSKLIYEFSLSDRFGIYHATNEGYCSWNELATTIFKLKNIDINVNKISTSEYKTAAKRPLNSRMSKDKLVKNGFTTLPHWKESLERYLKELDGVK
ncbi:dTDP-4-dehydrorhamnose reductase [Macrococcus capreoli]|uniref:dTDP-4-dehydrorhamnose reductase n=1 Tax=Macrococcus capreoli TaxID=2982690 RepID=UPI0021D5F146|nr:dTDP-4-dehydrorhamnose reductase [Macrococcus sp. TMW 2.2395]MCU7557546.1 dTDP-4-dehydrorhamnose reductase [Macrococcus sp. TMW 2.2395]